MRYLLLVAVLVRFFLFPFLFWHLNDGFVFHHIKSDLEFSDQVASLPEELCDNFYYLEKGRQNFVFESEDHAYVIKFFRFPRYQLPALVKDVRGPQFLNDLIKNRGRNKEEKLDRLFKSCQIAWDELREECGLVYVHLQQTDCLQKKINLKDRLGHCYELNLDDYAFIIQKKGEPLATYLLRLMGEERRDEAKRVLSDLVRLHALRIDKGIFDEDAYISKNSGVCEGKIFFIDIGGFFHQESGAEELSNITLKFISWLRVEDADLAQYLENCLKLESSKPSIGFR